MERQGFYNEAGIHNSCSIFFSVKIFVLLVLKKLIYLNSVEESRPENQFAIVLFFTGRNISKMLAHT